MAPRICQNNTRQTSTGHLNRHRLAMVTILAPIFTSRSLYRHSNADVSAQVRRKVRLQIAVDIGYAGRRTVTSSGAA
jgi:hypothetical protein